MRTIYDTHQERELRATEVFETGEIVIADDHFVYAAGGHGDAYVQKDKTLVVPDTFVEITGLMADDIADEVDPNTIDYLVGFAPCSSQYASRIAEHLNADHGSKPRVVFMEKVPSIAYDEAGTPYIHEELKFKRGFGDLLIGQRAWLIEDIVTTGKSLIEGKAGIEQIEGVELLGASAAYCRTPEAVNNDTLGLSIWRPLIEKSLTIYPAGECPMDSDLERYPVNTSKGHGQKWLSDQGLV